MSERGIKELNRALGIAEGGIDDLCVSRSWVLGSDIEEKG